MSAHEGDGSGNGDGGGGGGSGGLKIAAGTVVQSCLNNNAVSDDDNKGHSNTNNDACR